MDTRHLKFILVVVIVSFGYLLTWYYTTTSTGKVMREVPVGKFERLAVEPTPVGRSVVTRIVTTKGMFLVYGYLSATTGEEVIVQEYQSGRNQLCFVKQKLCWKLAE